MTASEPVLTVIIAVKEGAGNLPALLRRLDVNRSRDVEFIFCFAGTVVLDCETDSPNVSSLKADTASLVPHLWRDGIRAARGTRVALTTATCLPASDWVDRARDADVACWPGIGGVIDCDRGASAADHAVFFLRYSGFLPGGSAHDVDEIAADNAVYSRHAILEHVDLLDDGFWEPSFHARFRKAGLTLRLDPALRVTHVGGALPSAFAGHRFLHGRQYGRDRTQSLRTSKAVALLFASALVPAITLARIVVRVAKRPNYAMRLLKSSPWLLWFVFAWSAGEAAGYRDTVAGRWALATNARDRLQKNRGQE